MKKVLQKIVWIIAVVTVIAHSILPHNHHDKTTLALHHQEEEEQLPGLSNHHDDDKHDHHGLFSFAQLDDNFVPVNNQTNNFELPFTFLPSLIANYLFDNFPLNTKIHFSWYKEYPPPDKNFPPSSHRGPPTA